MDYFNEEERSFQLSVRKWRDASLDPLLRLLAARGITPTHVTLAAIPLLLVGVSAGPDHPWVPMVFLLAYCLMDGIDGPLARRTGTASEGGALLDIAVDQLGVVVVSAAAIHHLSSNGPATLIFACFYLAVIALLLYGARLGVPGRHVVRVKYPLYVVYCLAFLFQMDLITLFVFLFAPYYVVISALLLRDVCQHLTPDRP